VVTQATIQHEAGEVLILTRPPLTEAEAGVHHRHPVLAPKD